MMMDKLKWPQREMPSNRYMYNNYKWTVLKKKKKYPGDIDNHFLKESKGLKGESEGRKWKRKKE